MPVILMGALDQDVRDDTAVRYNRLYTPGVLNLFFSRRKFLVTAAQGVFSSLALVGIAVGTGSGVLRLAILQFSHSSPYLDVCVCVGL